MGIECRGHARLKLISGQFDASCSRKLKDGTLVCCYEAGDTAVLVVSAHSIYIKRVAMQSSRTTVSA